MEKYFLRVMVLVLAATCLGLWGMAHSKVMLHVPPKPSVGFPGPTGPTAVSGVTGPSGPTAAETLVVKPSPKGTVEDYFITLDHAKKMWDEAKAGKNIIFVDAREFIEYRDGHIAGSMSCPKRRFDGAVPGYIRNNLPGNTVVVYCHGADCSDSEAVIKRLIALKLEIGPFWIIKDGFDAWKNAGHPVNTGDNEGWQ